MPEITVIIPAYNAEKTILETIKSIQEQTFSNFEIIVINDGSTDDTQLVLEKIKEPRLKIISSQNEGVSAARNKGIKAAQSEYIAFIDADDLWTNDKLELQLAAIKANPDIGVVYSWTSQMDETGKKFHSGARVFIEGNVYQDLLIVNFLENGSTPLMRKECVDEIGGFNVNLKYGEDWEFYIRLAAKYKFAVIPKQQVFYRQSPSSATSKVAVMEQNLLMTLEIIYQSVPSHLQYLKNQTLAALYHYLAATYFAHVKNSSHINIVGQKLWTAISLNPKYLLDTVTIFYIFKWSIMKLFTPQIVKKLISLKN
ncbi:glycosyl transferase [Dulcicalothrix desertica PCC 7102]|uniref:Glycosyl transferase n=1 Tax=Dulcicalothrix desertica PCC 7102 TaxID=232991 RepID=A0A3S1CFW5_9CYAN|nr:glycosyltransferase [Dulcicalothrix desertica]RUT02707.1 glycosyl transferase [Dulcicalothrix desertica PCC 7102]TWH39058.1 glycosyltransferase involved in cell wall biosynthesis [Dulcicalothrix desertica PCC 7102]